MKTAMVTGATSFIGVNLIPLLLHSGYRVYGTVRKDTLKLTRLPSDINMRLITAEYDELPQVATSISDKIDIVYHLAWRGVRGAERDDDRLQEMNNRISTSLLRACVKLECKTFIDSGSQAEYGCHDGIVTEDSELHPETAYGYYKLRSFQELTDICAKHGVRYRHPRIFSLYGPGDYNGSMLTTMIRNILDGNHTRLTECSQFWDFLYVSDAARALLLLAETDCPDGAYNIAYGDIRRLRDFVEEVYAAIGTLDKPKYGEVPYPKGGSMSIQPDVTRLKALGWKPEITFAEGIKSVIAEYRRDRKELT